MAKKNQDSKNFLNVNLLELYNTKIGALGTQTSAKNNARTLDTQIMQ